MKSRKIRKKDIYYLYIYKKVRRRNSKNMRNDTSVLYIKASKQTKSETVFEAPTQAPQFKTQIKVTKSKHSKVDVFKAFDPVR